MISDVEQIAKQAGEAIWTHYQNESAAVESKADGTPVTTADLEANQIIMQGLRQISEFPILSEEVPVEYSERQHWSTYWLVDPLDGTKGFVSRTGDFTVNIALIENQRPILGVIYVPKTKDNYSAELGRGAFKNGKKIENTRTGPPTVGVASKLHQGGEKEYLENLGVTEAIYVNSSLKLCWLAEGKADVYPRMRPTMEWDTGAGEILLTEAGCEIVNQDSFEPLPHNSKELVNPPFIAYRKTSLVLA